MENGNVPARLYLYGAPIAIAVGGVSAVVFLRYPRHDWSLMIDAAFAALMILGTSAFVEWRTRCHGADHARHCAKRPTNARCSRFVLYGAAVVPLLLLYVVPLFDAALHGTSLYVAARERLLPLGRPLAAHLLGLTMVIAAMAALGAAFGISLWLARGDPWIALVVGGLFGMAFTVVHAPSPANAIVVPACLLFALFLAQRSQS